MSHNPYLNIYKLTKSSGDVAIALGTYSAGFVIAEADKTGGTLELTRSRYPDGLTAKGYPMNNPPLAGAMLLDREHGVLGALIRLCYENDLLNPSTAPWQQPFNHRQPSFLAKPPSSSLKVSNGDVRYRSIYAWIAGMKIKPQPAQPIQNAGLIIEKASPALIAEMQKSPRGREMLTRLQNGEAAVIFGDVSKLTAKGVTRTMGRYLQPETVKHLGLSAKFGMVIDIDFITSEDAPKQYSHGNAEAFYIFVMDNEFKAFDLSNNKQYTTADSATQQKMELASQAKDPTSNVDQKLMKDSIATANDPNGIYSKKEVFRLRDIQIPPGAKLIDFKK